MTEQEQLEMETVPFSMWLEENKRQLDGEIAQRCPSIGEITPEIRRWWVLHCAELHTWAWTSMVDFER